MDSLSGYVTEIVSFLVGACAGSLITIKVKKFGAGANGNAVDQSGSTARGDIVGRDKSEK